MTEKTASLLIKKLNICGHAAFLVGGCVRDKMLNRPICDYDITTSAKPDEVINLFEKDYELVTIGKRHGTIGVIIDNHVYEITTFRTEDGYDDHRHPNSVSFIDDVKGDLSRRDFTINALAYDAINDRVIDYFDGIGDLNNKIIRAVGDPSLRFKEDALRILRGLRFAATLGFNIEKQTLTAMIAEKSGLKDISRERITSELTKILCAPFGAKVLYSAKEILFELIIELKDINGFDQVSLSHDYDVLDHTLKAIEFCRDKNPVTCWTLLLHDIGKPLCFTVDKNGYGHTKGHMLTSRIIAEKVLARFSLPKRTVYDILNLIAIHDEDVAKTKYDVKKLICKFGIDFCQNLLAVKMADMCAHSDYGVKKYLHEKVRLREYLKEIIYNNECCDFSTLAINGDDLVLLGFKEKSVGEIKSVILDLVMRGDLNNERDDLLKFAVSQLNNL